jgi:hypothetical protein
MAKTWRRAIQKYGSLGAISFEKAFRTNSRLESEILWEVLSRVRLLVLLSTDFDF